jgi:hypothetical protein
LLLLLAVMPPGVTGAAGAVVIARLWFRYRAETAHCGISNPDHGQAR